MVIRKFPDPVLFRPNGNRTDRAIMDRQIAQQREQARIQEVENQKVQAYNQKVAQLESLMNVKIGSRNRWNNYQRFLRDTLPKINALRKELGLKGNLRYSLSKGFYTQSTSITGVGVGSKTRTYVNPKYKSTTTYIGDQTKGRITITPQARYVDKYGVVRKEGQTGFKVQDYALAQARGVKSKGIVTLKGVSASKIPSLQKKAEDRPVFTVGTALRLLGKETYLESKLVMKKNAEGKVIGVEDPFLKKSYALAVPTSEKKVKEAFKEQQLEVEFNEIRRQESIAQEKKLKKDVKKWDKITKTYDAITKRSDASRVAREKVRNSIEKAINKLEDWQLKPKVAGAKTNAWVNKFMSEIATVPYDFTIGLGRFAPEVLEKVGFQIAVLIQGDFRQTAISEIKQSVKDSPLAVAKSFDPRTPEGLANLVVTGAFIKVVGSRKAGKVQSVESIPKTSNFKVGTFLKTKKGVVRIVGKGGKVFKVPKVVSNVIKKFKSNPAKTKIARLKRAVRAEARIKRIGARVIKKAQKRAIKGTAIKKAQKLKIKQEKAVLRAGIRLAKKGKKAILRAEKLAKKGKAFTKAQKVRAKFEKQSAKVSKKFLKELKAEKIKAKIKEFKKAQKRDTLKGIAEIKRRRLAVKFRKKSAKVSKKFLKELKAKKIKNLIEEFKRSQRRETLKGISEIKRRRAIRKAGLRIAKKGKIAIKRAERLARRGRAFVKAEKLRVKFRKKSVIESKKFLRKLKADKVKARILKFKKAQKKAIPEFKGRIKTRKVLSKFKKKLLKDRIKREKALRRASLRVVKKGRKAIRSGESLARRGKAFRKAERLRIKKEKAVLRAGIRLAKKGKRAILRAERLAKKGKAFTKAEKLRVKFRKKAIIESKKFLKKLQADKVKAKIREFKDLQRRENLNAVFRIKERRVLAKFRNKLLRDNKKIRNLESQIQTKKLLLENKKLSPSQIVQTKKRIRTLNDILQETKSDTKAIRTQISSAKGKIKGGQRQVTQQVLKSPKLKALKVLSSGKLKLLSAKSVAQGLNIASKIQFSISKASQRFSGLDSVLKGGQALTPTQASLYETKIDNLLRTEQDIISDVIQIQKVIPTQMLGQQQAQQLKSIQQQALKTVTKLRQAQRKLLKLPKIKIKLTWDKPVPRGKVLVVNPIVRIKGRNVELKWKTTPNRARARIQKAVDNSTARSYSLKIVGLKKGKDIKPPSSKKFRPKKSRGSAVLPIVEKTKYAIDTRGEKSGLKLSQLLKRRRKSNAKKTKSTSIRKKRSKKRTSGKKRK